MEYAAHHRVLGTTEIRFQVLGPKRLLHVQALLAEGKKRQTPCANMSISV
jgi:hypothetical protein